MIHKKEIPSNVIQMKLVRLEDCRYGTFGVLLIHESIFCVTLEPPDKDNIQMKSCIPAGIYTCNRVKSPTYGNTFKVVNVPNRTHILFHRGNEIKDTKGCILLAEKFGKLRGNNAVLNSGLTFAKFLKVMSNCEIAKLEIVEV